MADIERDAQVIARGLIVALEHAVQGTVRVVASPLRLSETPVRYALPPPLAGEHTEEILAKRLSLSRDEIDALRTQEVI
jgi:crotonobetainyl-CoA:carnitine CoA-transferase CaiB-like acyl-CoA transferase